MSEREREAKWVLVPEDWLYSYDSQEGPPPPIPPDVWEQMVGRMVDVVHERVGMPTDETDDALLAACLRAALGISDE